MPTISHALVGGMMAFLLYIQSKNTISEKKFGKAHVLIFTINCFVGPDIGKLSMAIGGSASVFINEVIHTIFGWIIVSIPLAVLYFFIFNGFRSPKQHEPPINYGNTLKLIMAAGIFHFSLDALDQPTRFFPNFGTLPDWTISVDELKLGNILTTGPLTERFPDFGLSELFIISMGFLILIIWCFYKKSLKWTILIAGLYVVVFVALLFLLGSNIVHQENDLGFLIYGFIFWIIPLGLCFWSYQES